MRYILFFRKYHNGVALGGPVFEQESNGSMDDQIIETLAKDGWVYEGALDTSIIDFENPDA